MPPTSRFSFASTLAGGLLVLAAAAAPAAAPPGAQGPQRPVVAGPTGNSSEPLQIEQAWIRWLPANLPAGGYLTVTNRGDRPVVLVGASSADYAGVGLHRSVTEGGLSKMEAVAQIIVAPHTTLNFSDTGYHIMLTTPTLPVSPGSRVPITLHFADGRSLVVNFEVRPPGATAPAMPAMPGMPAKPH